MTKDWLDEIKQNHPWTADMVARVKEAARIDRRFRDIMEREGFDDGED